MTGISTAIDVAAGNNHTCAALDDGTVRCWGGASAVPVQIDGISTATAVRAGAGFSCALLADHTIRCWGVNSQGQLGNGSTTDSDAPVMVMGITTATAITLLDQSACALLVDQTRYLLGIQLGRTAWQWFNAAERACGRGDRPDRRHGDRRWWPSCVCAA